MKLTNYLSKERGNAALLAKSIGAHAPDISRWAKNESDKDFRPVPVGKCVAIVKATNGEVSLQELRPNDWMNIWPELEVVA